MKNTTLFILFIALFVILGQTKMFAQTNQNQSEESIIDSLNQLKQKKKLFKKHYYFVSWIEKKDKNLFAYNQIILGRSHMNITKKIMRKSKKIIIQSIIKLSNLEYKLYKYNQGKFFVVNSGNYKHNYYVSYFIVFKDNKISYPSAVSYSTKKKYFDIKSIEKDIKKISEIPPDGKVIIYNYHYYKT